jgi:hypothetical protein
MEVQVEVLLLNTARSKELRYKAITLRNLELVGWFNRANKEFTATSELSFAKF